MGYEYIVIIPAEVDVLHYGIVPHLLVFPEEGYFFSDESLLPAGHGDFFAADSFTASALGPIGSIRFTGGLFGTCADHP
jgi:hypothetical protein